MNHSAINIALADDDLDDQFIFKEAIEEIPLNTKLSIFNNGIELMEYLFNEHLDLPDIIFLDLNMPQKGGLGCLKEIKKNKQFDNITIAIYSTSSYEKHIENTFLLGANVYINKPNSFSELKKMLEKVLRRSWQYEQSGLNRDTFLLKV